MVAKESVSWESVIMDLNLLVGRLPTRKWEAIYAVPRGGFVIAGLLAYRLGVTKIYSTLGLDEVHARAYGQNYIVTDDILDTGKTYEAIRRRFRNATFVTLYKKISLTDEDGLGKYKEVLCGNYFDIDDWVSFPWAPGDTTRPGQTQI